MRQYMEKGWALVSLGLSGLLAGPAAAQEVAAQADEPAEVTYRSQGEALTVWQGDAQVASVALPCAVEAAPVVADARLYAACADGGLLVMSLATPLAPEPTEVRALEGPVARVFLVGGKAWIEIEGQGARALEARPAPPAPQPEAAEVVEEPEVEQPTADEVGPVVESEASTAPAAGGGGSLMARIVPERPPAHVALGLHLRGFGGMEGSAYGGVADATVGYHFDAPFAVELIASPVALTWADEGDFLGYNVSLLPSFDSRFLHVGLGLGVASFGSDPAAGNMVPGPDPEDPGDAVAATFVQSFRLGSADGVNGAVRTSLAFRSERVSLGEVTMSGQIPLGLFGHSWVRGRATVSQSGVLMVDAGFRVLLSGDGGPGSLYIEPTLGLVTIRADVWEPCRASPDALCRQEVVAGGPTGGLGMSWRL